MKHKKRKDVAEYLLCVMFEEEFIMRYENVFCALIQLDTSIRLPKSRACSGVFFDHRPSSGNGISKTFIVFPDIGSVARLKKKSSSHIVRWVSVGVYLGDTFKEAEKLTKKPSRPDPGALVGDENPASAGG